MIKVIPHPDNKAVMLQIENTPKDWRRGVRQGFFELGRELVQDAKEAITKGPKTGRLYRVKGRRRRHRASAPGQAPANLSGNLRNNVGFQIHGSDSMDFGYRDGAEYGKFLENGTIRMKPRPNIEPTVLKNNRNAENIFAANIGKQIKR